MVCVYCGGETQVINSRGQRRVNAVWRRRRCQDCGAICSTQELVQLDKAWRVQRAEGAAEPFSRDKLLLSLYTSCQHRPDALKDAAGLADTVIQKLRTGSPAGLLNSTTIAHTTTVVLSRFDTVAATHYQAFHPHKRA